jgi:hypothetical protein
MIIAALLALPILLHVSSILVAGATSEEEHNVAIQKVHAVFPDGVQMVDAAITTLAQGWSGMSAEERALFLRYFDPSNTGEIDDAYVLEVLENYRKIRRRLDEEMVLVYAGDSDDGCSMMGLYYTDFNKVYVCPYMNSETNGTRIARGLVHETAHMAFVVFDRAYYSTSNSAYTSLTPRGHWSGRLPVIGRLMREIVRSDTLYNPDTYAHFAVQLVAQPQDAPAEAHTESEEALGASISPEVMR